MNDVTDKLQNISDVVVLEPPPSSSSNTPNSA